MSQPHAKTNTLLKSSLIVSILTLGSRILGLVRDVVLLNIFGASGLMDAFLVAFKIPNFLRRLFSEGAFAQGFIPVLARYQSASFAELQIFISRVFGSFALLLSIVSCVVIMIAPLIIGAFAVGFVGDIDKFHKTVDLFRLSFPYVMLITLTAFASSILQSFGRFVLVAMIPMILNISLIVFAVFASQYFYQPIFSLGVAVCVAGLLQLITVLIPLYQQNLLTLPKIDFAHHGVKQVLNLLLPAVLGVSVLQINLLVNTFFASFLPTGSVSWLYTAERMSEFPLGLIGVAIGTVILPVLSKNFHKNELTKTLDWACYLLLLVGVPAVFALWQIADVLMLALFWHGEFSQNDALMSGLGLRYMAVGLLALMFIKVIAPVFFVHGDSGFVLKASLWAILANVLSVLALLCMFAKFALPLHGALAWAVSISAWVNFAILFGNLYKKRIFVWSKLWQKRLLQIMFANMIMIIILQYLLHFFPAHASQTMRILALFGICLAGGLGYFLALFFSGFRLKMINHA